MCLTVHNGNINIYIYKMMMLYLFQSAQYLKQSSYIDMDEITTTEFTTSSLTSL